MFFVYIIHAPSKDKFYVGQTQDVQNRLEQHKVRRNLGAVDWGVVFVEKFDSRSEAVARERQVKARKSMPYILDLIQNKLKGIQEG